ncbi:tetratricopeptide repeat protein [Stieleria varia]|uniref:Uncharacterized protein n=1 Tax=Stieleria varia TaxID=2528005 RepID=A0A5C6AZB7_9BACT|nr:tetratricopeptide repeat protein [Stieleria varia]TWU04499.1 hypothetical protein Pla52n_25400 [Stieleria varia]
MPQIVRCSCGQQLQVEVPPQGVRVRCPSCSAELSLSGQPTAPVSQPVVPFSPASAPPSTGSNPFGTAAAPHRPTAPKNASPVKILAIVVASMAALLLLACGGVFALQSFNGGGQAVALEESDKPVTKAEVEKVSAEIESGLQSGAIAIVESHIDWERMIAESIANLDLNAGFKSQFGKGLLQGIQTRGWAGPVHQATSGNVKLLRVRDKERGPVALLRIEPTGAGVGYFEIAYFRDTDDKVKVADIYNFATGEWLTETLYRMSLPLVAEQNKSILEKLNGNESLLVKHLSDLERIRMLGQTNPDAALRSFRTLPPSVQQDKSFMILRITIATQAEDDSEYDSALKDFMRLFPNDPAAALFSIDYYALQGELDKSIAAIDKLNEMVGGDAALLVLRASVHSVSGDTQAAKEDLNKAIEMEPEHKGAQEMLRQL